MRRLLNILLVLSSLLSSAGSTDTLWVRSACHDSRVPVLFVCPDSGYDSSTPVVVLLHGYGGDFASWVRNSGSLPALADHYGVVFVAPDAGDNWYFDSEANGNRTCAATFPAIELIAFLRDSMELANSPGLTAICGNSMGGHGALRLAGLHPGLFGIAGSLSGVIDLRASRKTDEVIARFAPGDSLASDTLSVIAHLKRLGPYNGKLFIDCGSDDYLLPANLVLHQRLLDAGIDHVWLTRPGGHSWAYWDESIGYFMVFATAMWDR